MCSSDHPENQAPIPARMLNEWTYCPRLGILEWVHAEFDHNAETLDGKWKHRRVDRPGRPLPDPDAPHEHFATRSLWLTAEGEGITARIDLIELNGLSGDADHLTALGDAHDDTVLAPLDDEVIIVETKRGVPAPTDDQVWEPERVQLCAQALVLREHGYTCRRGFIWFVDARRRVEVVFDDDLVARTRELAASFRAAAVQGTLPPPLDHSPKCPRCSLVGICLPDETIALASLEAPEALHPRRLIAPHTEALPLYVTEQGAKVRTSKGEIIVEGEDGKAKVRWRETSQIAVFGRVAVTTPALTEAMQRDVPVCFYSFGGWFNGLATGLPHKNAVLRMAQYEAARDPERSLQVAREIVRSKIRNQRTLLRRSTHNGHDAAEASTPLVEPYVFSEMHRLAETARAAEQLSTLLGLEGSGARLYFQHFASCFKSQGQAPPFDFSGRNRRPPKDPVNAMLSLAYSRLVGDALAALVSMGLDPYIGLFHQPRYGRPALALDLMEEFRPLIADSVVLTAINNGEVGPGSFVQRATGCNLTAPGRKAFYRCYERRMAQELTHPIFEYRISWRRMLEVQARLLGRWMLGEIPRYVPIETR